jgi:hypothetical protein
VPIILLRIQKREESGISHSAQGDGGKESAVEAVHGARGEGLGGTTGVASVVRHLVEQLLHLRESESVKCFLLQMGGCTSLGLLKTPRFLMSANDLMRWSTLLQPSLAIVLRSAAVVAAAAVEIRLFDLGMNGAEDPGGMRLF